MSEDKNFGRILIDFITEESLLDITSPVGEVTVWDDESEDKLNSLILGMVGNVTKQTVITTCQTIQQILQGAIEEVKESQEVVN